MEEILDFDNNDDRSNKGPSLMELSQGYQFNFGNAIGRGWAIFAKYPWGFMGYSVVCFILSALSVFVLFLTVPALLAGFDIVASKIAREEHFEFNDFFGAFKKFGPWVGLWAITLIGSWLLSFILEKIGIGVQSQIDISQIQDLDPSDLMGLMLGQQLISIAITIVFHALMIFLFPLIAVSKLGLLDAIKWSAKISIKKIFPFIGLVVISVVGFYLGAFACLVGLIFTYPVATLLKFGAFDEIFGSHSRENEV